jgi:GNAT superfamily N-acetyltransferase
MSVAVRPAAPDDAGVIFGFIRGLAEYEKLADELVAGPDDIAGALFEPSPRVFCDIAEADGRPVGLALWFYTYSTFRGRHGMWLEDLYVDPEARGRGVGKALLAHLARRCLDEGLPLLEWAVLDWNAPAIALYDGVGAEVLGGWTNRQLEGDALERLAGG